MLYHPTESGKNQGRAWEQPQGKSLECCELSLAVVCQLPHFLADSLGEAKLVRARGRQRTDSTHVLAAIQALNRLECIGETMRHALNTLARVAPEWMREQAEPEWFERYARQFEESRLPSSRTERYALAETIGRDGHHLLRGVYGDAPEWIRHIPAVETLRQVWVQQFQTVEGVVRWREAGNLPPAARNAAHSWRAALRTPAGHLARPTSPATPHRTRR